MSNKPADHSIPGDPQSFITSFQDPADERIDVGVLFVGAGPASLAGAIRLMQLLEDAPELLEGLGEVPVAVIEKGKYPGAHLLSGAVVNPAPFTALFPDLHGDALPFYQAVTDESVYYLTEKGSLKAPIIPPTMLNHGNFVASLSKIGQWLGEKSEELGVMILNETVGRNLIVEDHAVRGVRTGDKGLDRDGNQLPNFEAGSDLSAKVTVLGEGAQGHLSQLVCDHFSLKRDNPQIYALGVKEIWQVENPLTRIIHTMGWPLRGGKAQQEFGGSFVYPMGPDKVSIGLVVGMDYRDSALSTHDLLQQFKSHPLIKPILAGGQRTEDGWGAKTIPEGGYYALPEKFHVPGAVMLGDAAGFVNVPALKGIHYAMWSGIYAAEAIFERLKGDPSPDPLVLDNYEDRVRDSAIISDLYKVRNMRQAFQKGFWTGSFLAGLMTLTGGVFPGWRMEQEADSHAEMSPGSRDYPKADNTTTFDKLSSVFASGNRSRDNQPDHLRFDRNASEVVGQTWINMCPAEVYEWQTDGEGRRFVQSNPTNCVQCGAIGAKGGRLTPPEGGSGPEYRET